MKKNHWLDLAEYTSLVGLGIGSVATVVTSQMWFASAPLSLLVLLNLANRKRLDSNLQQDSAIAINNLDQKFSKHIELLNQNIQNLPTPEMLAGLKKSLLIKDREVLTQLSTDISSLKQQVQSQLEAFKQLEVGELRTEMGHLQTQFTQLQDGVSQMQSRLGHLTWAVRDGEAERAIVQIQNELSQVRTNLQRLSEQTRPTLTSLQEQITHLQRQMQKLPPPFDSTALRQEVTELVRVVADLVPRREWATVVQEIQALQQQQEFLAESSETIHRQLQELHQQVQSQPSRSNLTTLQNQITHLNRQLQELPAPFDPALLKQKLAELAKTVAERVPQQDFSGLVAQVKSLQQQQSNQAQAEVLLRREIQALQEQIQVLANEGNGDLTMPPHELAAAWEAGISAASWQDYLQATLAHEFDQIQQRLEQLPREPDFRRHAEVALQNFLRLLNDQLREQLQSTTPGLEYEFVFNGPAAYDVEPNLVDNLRGGRSLLEEALANVRQHLLLVLPWSRYYELDDVFLHQLEGLLQRNCRVDLGWCHVDEPRTARFLHPITQRWQLQSTQQKRLQETLRQLLHLKRNYPDLLQFKILGIQESFLVVDQVWAAVGITHSIPGLGEFPEVGLKVQTTDAVVVQQLTDWFEHPILAAMDELAHWNRAVTYYDLGDRDAALADLERLLAINPEDALALNLRGVVRYDRGDRQGAIADFTQALEINPRMVVTYCNRGYVHSELDDQLDAITDFNAALRLQPNSAIAYFYRGTACQKFGEVSVAIANFDETIRLAPNSAPAYYYRGMARTRTEDYEEAIADMERAARLFEQEGSLTNAQKAQTQLEKLRKVLTNQTSAA